MGKLLIRQWKKWERHQETEDEASTRRSSLTEDERTKLSKNNQASPGVDPFIVHSIEWAHGKVQLPPPRSGSSLMITAGGAALTDPPGRPSTDPVHAKSQKCRARRKAAR